MEEINEVTQAVYQIKDILFKNLDERDFVELDQFSYIDYQWGEQVEWNGFPIYCSENSDRGWDDDMDDYKRNIKQQILYELNSLRNNIEIITDILNNKEYFK